jgi:hypothetical protein
MDKDEFGAGEILSWIYKNDPGIALESGGDIHCFYCHAWIENDYEPHKDDCIYLKARSVLHHMLVAKMMRIGGA